MLHIPSQQESNQRRAPPKHAREKPYLSNRQRGHHSLQDLLKQRDLTIIMPLSVKTPNKIRCRVRPFNSADIFTKRREGNEFIHFLTATAGRIDLRRGN